MKKIIIAGLAMLMSFGMLTTSCDNKKNNEESNNWGNSNGVETNMVKDIDGNVYKTVKIGDQIWMAENLRTTCYADGKMIPLGDTTSFTEPYRYNPDGKAENVFTYGYLYNWPAVMHGEKSSDANPSHVQGICPDGWHVPSDTEWTQLMDYVSSQSQFYCGDYMYYIAKALASTTSWESVDRDCCIGDSLSLNNATGFSALPAGTTYRNKYYCIGQQAFFWSATATEFNSSMAYHRYLDYNNAYEYRDFDHLDAGFSVRCVRN